MNNPPSSNVTRTDRTTLMAAILLSVVVLMIEIVLHAPAAVMFTLSGITLALLAWVLGEATDQLGHTVGSRIAAVLNATLGNLPELVVVMLLIHQATATNGYLEVAKASILGSVLGNMLLVLGLSFFLGGLKHGTQKFTINFASLNSSMLLLATAAIAVPTAISHLHTGEAYKHIEEISVAAAIVLLVSYIGSMIFFLRDTQEHVPVESGEARWTRKFSLFVLAGAAVGVGILSEILVGSIEHTVEDIGISQTFVGFILVPMVGNIAEHLVAVQLAWRNDMDFAMTIALGSSAQVALAVAPLAVFGSYLLGNPLDLVFQPLQLLAMAAAVIIMPVLVYDGESTWLEGLQLLAVYTLIGIAFWY